MLPQNFKCAQHEDAFCLAIADADGTVAVLRFERELIERLHGRFADGRLEGLDILVLLIDCRRCEEAEAITHCLLGQIVCQHADLVKPKPIRGQCAGLVHAQHVDGGHRFDRVQVLDQRSAGAHAHSAEREGEDARRGFMLGFLTREFTIDRGHGPMPMVAVYIPTNNLYLGDIVICERARAMFPDITVEDGIRIFLTGGMALPPKVRI